MPFGATSRLLELNSNLLAPPTPGGNYVPVKTVGNLAFLAGVISIGPDGVISGSAGLDRTVDDGYAAVRHCALMQPAVIQRHLGSLDVVKSIVTVNGYVNAVQGFPDSLKVINGVSDLFIEIFGESARHLRAAIGVSALPRNALVELQMSVEIQELL